MQEGCLSSKINGLVTNYGDGMGGGGCYKTGVGGGACFTPSLKL